MAPSYKSPCIICGYSFTSSQTAENNTNKGYSLASKAKELPFLCGDVFDYLFKDLKILNGNLINWEPTGKMGEEARYICWECLSPMKKAYVNLKILMNRMSSDCTLKAHLEVDQQTKTETEIVGDDATATKHKRKTTKTIARIKPKTVKLLSIPDVVRRFNTCTRFQTAFYNYITRTVYAEVKTLGKESEGLKGPNIVLREEDLNPDFQLIFQELASKAPLFGAVLQGAFKSKPGPRGQKDVSGICDAGRYSQPKKYLPPITAIIAIILRFRTTRCILFQKYMSLMMYKKRSNMSKLSDFLFKFGFACTWHSLRRILDPMEATGNLQEDTENDGEENGKEDEDPNSEVGNDSDQDQDEIEATSKTETEIRGNPDMLLIKDEVLSDASDVESGSKSTLPDHSYQKKCPDNNQKKCMNQSSLVDDQEIKTEPISPPCSPPSAKKRKETESEQEN